MSDEMRVTNPGQGNHVFNDLGGFLKKMHDFLGEKISTYNTKGEPTSFLITTRMSNLSMNADRADKARRAVGERDDYSVYFGKITSDNVHKYSDFLRNTTKKIEDIFSGYEIDSTTIKRDIQSLYSQIESCIVDSAAVEAIKAGYNEKQNDNFVLWYGKTLEIMQTAYKSLFAVVVGIYNEYKNAIVKG
jgi:hypothetical protein